MTALPLTTCQTFTGTRDILPLRSGRGKGRRGGAGVKSALALFGLVLLAACEEMPAPALTPAEVALGGQLVATSGNQPAGPDHPVTVARALQLFDAVCGASLADDFASARQRMAANGVDLPSPNGTATVYSTTEDVSFQIQDGPGYGNTCSFIFGASEGPAAVAAGLGQIGPFQPSPLGLATLYRGQRVLVLLFPPEPGDQQENLYNLRLLSDR